MSKKVSKREVRWSYHLRSGEHRDDAHYIKELVTFEDGSKQSVTHIKENIQRPIYVTAEPYRKHKDHKEFEDKDKLITQMTTESEKDRTAARMLGLGYLGRNLRGITKSPYLYGYDITSTSLLKMTSINRNNGIQSPYTVGAFDIETSMKDESILMATTALKNGIHTSVRKDFVKGIDNPGLAVKLAIEKYLPEYKDIPLNLTFHNNEIDLLTDIFATTNREGPDFLAIWNMDFDIPRILDRIEKNNGDPRDIICDQTVSRKYHQCWYKEGPKKLVTASGKLKPIDPSLQWHSFHSTSRFLVMDAMCVYRQLRLHKAAEASYSLDYILNLELGKRKLNFKEADGYEQGEWHTFMQENYPIEYIVYNIYDCLAMLELEDKNKDLSMSLPENSGITDFWKYGSSVTKATNSLFLYGLTQNKVIGTVDTSNRKSDEEDEDLIIDEEDIFNEDTFTEDVNKYRTLGLSGWIQFLPQAFMLRNGLKCLEDFPDVVTNVHGLTFDADSTSSYPSCTIVGNVSRETCVNEVIDIEGIPEWVFREQNMSLALGEANMLEYFNVMFKLPSLEEIDTEVDKILRGE